MSDNASPAPSPPTAAIPPRPRRRRLKYFAWFLILTAGFVYFYLLDGWSDVTRGRLRNKAQATFSYYDTDELTEVRIYLLQGVPGKETGEEFPGWYKARIYDSVTLTGKDFARFGSLWHAQMINDAMSGMCHEPAYGFRLYRDGRMIVETALCWHCKNFSVRVWPFKEPSLYGFDADEKAGQELLAFCDRLLPYYRIPPSPGRKPAKSAAPPPAPEQWPY